MFEKEGSPEGFQKFIIESKIDEDSKLDKDVEEQYIKKINTNLTF